MGRAVIDFVLLGLSPKHVLADEGRDLFDAVLHFFDVFDDGSERTLLFFPCLLCHVQQAPGPPPKEQLK